MQQFLKINFTKGLKTSKVTHVIKRQSKPKGFKEWKTYSKQSFKRNFNFD